MARGDIVTGTCEEHDKTGYACPGCIIDQYSRTISEQREELVEKQREITRLKDQIVRSNAILLDVVEKRR